MLHKPQMAGSRQDIRCYFWLQDQWLMNLGDCLATVVLSGLGYRSVSCSARKDRTVNPDRCLFPIGSTLYGRLFERIREPIDVWGCGWRGDAIPSELLQNVHFHAVRGPRTQKALRLSKDVPLGDPALLIPDLYARQVSAHGRTLVVPHFYRVFNTSTEARRALTGCDHVLSVQVLGSWARPTRSSLKRAWTALRGWIQGGVTVLTVWDAIEQVAGADFVLTGSLHGAILAQAYDVPWAAYNDGYVDVPEKWYDWADYLGIRISFVSDLRAGIQWWRAEGRRGRLQDTTPLLTAFPYPRIGRAVDDEQQVHSR